MFQRTLQKSALARGEIVDARDPVSVSEQPVDEGTADKSGAACYDDYHGIPFVLNTKYFMTMKLRHAVAVDAITPMHGVNPTTWTAPAVSRAEQELEVAVLRVNPTESGLLTTLDSRMPVLGSLHMKQTGDAVLNSPLSRRQLREFHRRLDDTA